jgi:hypothetical protein
VRKELEHALQQRRVGGSFEVVQRDLFHDQMEEVAEPSRVARFDGRGSRGARG